MLMIIELLAKELKKYSHKVRHGATLIILITVSLTSQVWAADDKQRILVLGDSLSAAYGIQVEEGWVSLLQEKLSDHFIVHNASISGETTDGGLEALPRHLKNHAPDIVILELGANDGLRGFPIDLIKQNLEAMISLSLDAGAEVLLLGMHIPPNFGPRYTEAFHNNFIKLAEEKNVALVPFLLEGVALKQELMQDDGLHPKAEAQPTILETVMRKLQALLNQAQVGAQENQAPESLKSEAVNS
jgi:acyl-CoA thioesterase-1